MGTEKYRRKAYFMGGVTFKGSLTVKANSASNQAAGVTRVGCGLASAVVSTTAVTNSSMIQLAVSVTSGHTLANTSYICGPISVLSRSSGGYFTLGYPTGYGHINQQVDVAWSILLPTS